MKRAADNLHMLFSVETIGEIVTVSFRALFRRKFSATQLTVILPLWFDILFLVKTLVGIATVVMSKLIHSRYSVNGLTRLLLWWFDTLFLVQTIGAIASVALSALFHSQRKLTMQQVQRQPLWFDLLFLLMTIIAIWTVAFPKHNKRDGDWLTRALPSRRLGVPPVKRGFDLMLALLGLILLSPVMTVIAIAVKVSSPGSILYAQTRVGLHGRHFKLYKFRSMVINAEKLGTSVTTSIDRRITPIGRFLRKTKLDELPQLWNVVRGDMSLVGPRPDVPEIVATYTSGMRRIFDVLPGITSQASLYLRDEEQLLSLTEVPDALYISVLVPAKVDLAMEHVQRKSFWFDLLILVKTVAAIALGPLWSFTEPVGLTALREFFDSNHPPTG